MRENRPQSEEANRKRSESLIRGYRKYPVILRGSLRIPRELRFCECGCGKTFKCKVNSKRRYINGCSKKGYCHSKESREKMRKVKLGANNPFSGRKHSAETHRKQRRAALRRWQNPEYIRNQIRSKGLVPNKQERILEKFLQEILPGEYKFVGNGDFILAGRCPDFVNVNGRKKIIEFFGDYWHGSEVRGVSNKIHEQERKAIFAEYGYQTLIVWERELEDVKKLKEKIIMFDRLEKFGKSENF